MEKCYLCRGEPVISSASSLPNKYFMSFLKKSLCVGALFYYISFKCCKEKRKMARGRVQLKKIENPVNRLVTFSKRKSGLLKKATELSLLCDAEVALITFSPNGNLFDFASTSMDRIIGKYQSISSSMGHQIQSPENIETLRLEVENLGKTIAHLERTNKHMIGEDLDSLSFKRLQYLEKKTSLGMRKIRSRKDKILFERMTYLDIKGQSLMAENAKLGT